MKRGMDTRSVVMDIAATEMDMMMMALMEVAIADVRHTAANVTSVRKKKEETSCAFLNV